jgi:hypothetical protein
MWKLHTWIDFIDFRPGWREVKEGKGDPDFFDYPKRYATEAT